MAIIVVLAAVAIPTFGRQLETARETGDLEVIRSAYTEALTIAVLDASDGLMDGKNGGTAFPAPVASGTETNVVTAVAEGTADDTKNSYTVTLALMNAKSTIKQTGTGWQFVDNSIIGVEVPQVDKTTTSVTFQFELTNGNVQLVGNTGTVGSVTASGITTNAATDKYSGTT